MRLLNSIAWRIRRRLTISHLQILRFFHKDRPIPLSYWLGFRSILGSLFPFPNPISTPYDILKDSGASLKAQELRDLLWNDILGTWSLDVATINYLWDSLKGDSPRTIVECGTGVSSLILAQYTAYLLRSSEYSSVFSIEQSIEVKLAFERRLADIGLDKNIEILFAPISKQGAYGLDIDELDEKLGARKVDWLLIDGPLGPKGCRVWTLPLLSKFCRPGARWFLDDAFRDGELQVLQEWERTPGITVEGILPIGKGLGTGRVYDPNQVKLRLSTAFQAD